MKKIFLGIACTGMVMTGAFASVEKTFAAPSLETPGLSEAEILEAYEEEFGGDYDSLVSNPEFFTAASYSYRDYFMDVRWTNRDGMISLHMLPTSVLYSANGNERMGRAMDAFNMVKSRFSGDYRWKNTVSMEAQFHCHVLGAGARKTQWNLEPHRTTTNLAVVMRHGCNAPN